MTFSVNPGPGIFVVIGIVIALLIFSLFIKQGYHSRKITAAVITALICTGILFIAGRPGKLIINENEIICDRFFGFSISLKDVSDFRVVEDLENSEFRPSRRISGMSSFGFKEGAFRLENGSKARILIQQTGKAAVIRTSEDLFIIAPKEIEKFLNETEKFISLDRNS